MAEALPVSPLAAAEASRNWETLRRQFRSRTCLALGQSWRRGAEPLFAAGHVRVALSGMALAVLGQFRDRDVFNPVEHFGVPAFPHGDTFEIFLQPAGQASYFELHVTPGGAVLQLRWPGPMREIPLDWTAAADPLLPFKVTRWRVRPTTRVTRDGWEVYVEVPLRRIFEAGVPWTGAVLHANFARYDYTRGRLRPVLSATAPLTQPDFHRAADWNALELRFR